MIKKCNNGFNQKLCILIIKYVENLSVKLKLRFLCFGGQKKRGKNSLWQIKRDVKKTFFTRFVKVCRHSTVSNSIQSISTSFNI